MNKKINKRIEEILDASYELCENSDSAIASQANALNNKTYELKKDLIELRRSMYGILYKISEKKKIDLSYILKQLKDQKIDLGS